MISYATLTRGLTVTAFAALISGPASAQHAVFIDGAHAEIEQQTIIVRDSSGKRKKKKKRRTFRGFGGSFSR